jgi:hypothetical protein
LRDEGVTAVEEISDLGKNGNISWEINRTFFFSIQV